MKKVGQRTIEDDRSQKNPSKYPDLIGKQNLVLKNDSLPVKRQCGLLGLNRTGVYEEPTAGQVEHEELIKSRLDYRHTKQCCLGVRGLRTRPLHLHNTDACLLYLNQAGTQQRKRQLHREGDT